ncbi:MAG TPA: UrcA family protein [Steroidobacteraceae bacterium]|jgi:UrcA family protein
MCRFKLKFVLSYVLAGLVAGPVSALAAPSGLIDQESRKVEYGDLDLTRDAGVATLYSRIRTAARAVCEPTDLVMLNLLRDRTDCRPDAIARAVADVNAPLLTSYFLERTNAGNSKQKR